ncbi:TonB-dependent receptor [Tenacibaculum maritimum]|uniref:TonB-dependent receptor n=1 Tax=Tenacibaculum maritimum TaxID=107401 RepID=UPI0012E5E22D|nr:TonB-dependent receptor [Tenacibaculum maritimum]CAA0232747.1 TonB-dependent outer membrane receptor [Tenacibaculum maritimum]CAA0261347.1 TonB-dependent outer membrane receptor [Tenacibaculum maritimum]
MRFLFISALLLSINAHAQIIIKGQITDKDGALPFASITIKNTSQGVTSDDNGRYSISTKKEGKITITAAFTGYLSERKTIDVSNKNQEIILNFQLTEHAEILDQVTITGTRTDKRRTNSPVIVNVVNSETLANVQACTLSEGLKFQTGLRVETDCQTCNYTQLRMNGLAGGYSQILINGRPIFSPLTGLYGLEQIPTNMIDRIEVVRGGGSALYGSSAIGGTVNVITKIPKKNNYEVSYTYQNTKGMNDHIITGNATVVNEEKNAGASFFINNRNRGLYDANGDNFSELPELKNNSFGTNIFFLPTENQKLEINFSKMNEYRYGGEMVDKAPHLALQSEERTHDVYIGNIDYQINFNDNKSAIITYAAAQYTGRDHYTGIFPDDPTAIQEHLKRPPYGTSETTTFQGGVQLNHQVENFLNGNAVFTVGSEYVQDDVFDEITAYEYKVDQLTKNLGIFFQSDWEITNKLNLLAGIRFDNHQLNTKPTQENIPQTVTNNVLSPRISFLFKPFENSQLRATWGTGFRAPQAFDTDLHIAFAGGGVSRVQLAQGLKRERSNSYNVSFNYDKPTEHYIYGFTVESFYTQLKDAFFLYPIGEDQFGERFEKRNGDGAVVQGITLETRLNYDQILQLETGFTFQSSLFDTAVKNSDVLEAKREFLRTPNNYGYATLTYQPSKSFTTAFNYIYTGSMDILHLAGAPELPQNDTYITSPSYHELSVKSSYTFNLNQLKTGLQIFGGVKNIFDAYQTNFDSGKNRDSNFIYGPSTPRTIFVGLKLGTGL